MILSSGPLHEGVASPLWLAAAAVLAYAVAAWPGAQRAAWSALALVVGWGLHLGVLLLDIGGWGQTAHGARLGFAPVLSMTVWLVLAVHTIESRFVPLPTVRRVLAMAGAAAVALAWSFPGEVRPVASAWAPFHFALGVASYGLFGAAVLHAALLGNAERRLRLRPGASRPDAGGMPLLQLERLTFRFVEAGFAVLTATLLLGVLTSAQWTWDHKTVFSMLAWAVFAALLLGRWLRGWRGQRATRWLYAGAALLLLAYVGSRFVLEVLLQRAT
jgi:ABC-type uncharacterized transport system permease subunit